ncbi:MAG: BA14K family protein [Hyphomicrobiaceae bacterium]|nr:BA14K family protein [Hyphomicrobiaceae bacterium]
MFAASIGTPATAAPFAGTPDQPGARAAVEFEQVQWRRGRRGGMRWHGPGAGVAILGGVILGGALVASAIAERRARDTDLNRCARDFRDFDPRTGTFVDNRGDVRVCPYLH